MAIYHDIGDTIEGKKIRARVRKWNGGTLCHHPETNEIMKLFTSDRNSHAEILRTYDGYEDAEIQQRTAYYHRNVGDGLTADAISFYTDRKFSLKQIVKEGVTARHGAMIDVIDKHCIATIRVPLQNLMKKLTNNKKHLNQ